jgi:TPR repeat protein
MPSLAASMTAVVFFGLTASGHTPSKTAKRPDGSVTSRPANAADASSQFEVALNLMERSKFSEAARLFTKAASQGHRLAQCNLGALYAQGLGVPKDIQQALRWYRAAAEQGDEMAMYNLGALYITEQRNVGLAIEWFEKAAAKGYLPAHVNLGMLYWRGDGVERSSLNARRWLLRAAEQKDANAWYALAMVALEDPGSPPDKVSAFACFSLSAVNGSERAMAARQQLEATMTSNEVKQGQDLARQWRASGPPKEP